MTETDTKVSIAIQEERTTSSIVFQETKLPTKILFPQAGQTDHGLVNYLFQPARQQADWIQYHMKSPHLAPIGSTWQIRIQNNVFLLQKGLFKGRHLQNCTVKGAIEGDESLIYGVGIVFGGAHCGYDETCRDAVNLVHRFGQ